MDINSIKTELIALLSELFQNKGIDTDLLEYVDLIDDMGMDSITFISIVVEVEAHFQITVPDDMLLLENFRTVDGIMTIVTTAITTGNTVEEV